MPGSQSLATRPALAIYVNSTLMAGISWDNHLVPGLGLGRVGRVLFHRAKGNDAGWQVQSGIRRGLSTS